MPFPRGLSHHRAQTRVSTPPASAAGSLPVVPTEEALWIHVSPQDLYLEILTPKSDGVRSWGLWEGHEGKALTYGISAL